jgi:hypothetical protein
MNRNLGDRYGLDLAAPLDWATLVDRAAETGCVDEMLDLQAMFSIKEADRLFHSLAGGPTPPADFPALVRAAITHPTPRAG